MACSETQNQMTLDHTSVGFGCSKEDAVNDFFSKALDKAEAQLSCSTQECDKEGFSCVAEVMDQGAIETALHFSRVRMSGCGKSRRVGWKCYRHVAPTSSNVTIRCTCAPAGDAKKESTPKPG